MAFGFGALPVPASSLAPEPTPAGQVPLSGFGFGPLPAIRRSVIDPATGNVTQGPQTPPSALDIGGAYLDLLASRAKDAVTAPQRALSGELQVWNPETGHTTDAASEAASGMAGLAMTGSLPMSAPAGALRMFGGRNAATADHAALSKAEEMLGGGADRGAVWDQTGWFKGADGKMRFEIPDDASRMTPNAGSTFEAAKVGEASSDAAARTLMHRDLYDAYPEMRQMQVEATKGGGYPYQPSGEYRSFASGKDAVGVNARSPDEFRDLALHEMQHGVQQREGFAPGGNPDNLQGIPQEERWKAARGAYEDSAGDNALLRELGVDVADVDLKPWDQMSKREQVKWLEAGRGRVYHQLAGEVEARNVQTRRDMTPEQRRATPPWMTQDVPDVQQIVNMNASQPAAFGFGPLSRKVY